MNPAIATVTLNAAIDKTYYMPQWRHGSVMRAERTLAQAGGKGVNVARVLRQLGHDAVTATGFVAGQKGRFIVERLRASGVAADFSDADGESRLCLNFIDGSDGSSTEVLEAGPAIRPEHAAAFEDKLRAVASRSGLVVFSGSMPQGCPPDWYAKLIGIARAEGALTLLDTSGAALTAGLAAAPAFVKPNEDEIRPWAGAAGEGEDGLRVAMERLAAHGVGTVVVTLGAEGAVARVEGRWLRVSIPRLEAVNPVGSGDAFVAGYAYGAARGWEPERCLRHAAAAGCANALSATAGDVRPDDHARLLGEIAVTEWHG